MTTSSTLSTVSVSSLESSALAATAFDGHPVVCSSLSAREASESRPGAQTTGFVRTSASWLKVAEIVRHFPSVELILLGEVSEGHPLA